MNLGNEKLLNEFAIVAIASISIISCKKEGMTTSSRNNVKNTPSFLYREGGALEKTPATARNKAYKFLILIVYK